MSDYTLSVPEELYERVQKIAEKSSQPVERVLLDYLRLFAEATPLLDDEEEAELYAMRFLSDDALWSMAREQMPLDKQGRMQVLMDKNSEGTIQSQEYDELSQLVERGQRLMLRKSEAAALLTKRGHRVKPEDMANRD
jgi:hypothetical protein